MLLLLNTGLRMSCLKNVISSSKRRQNLYTSIPITYVEDDKYLRGRGSFQQFKYLHDLKILISTNLAGVLRPVLIPNHHVLLQNEEQMTDTFRENSSTTTYLTLSQSLMVLCTPSTSY